MVVAKTIIMLLINLSEAETQELNYKRYYYPCPIIQKRMHAVYIKSICGISNEAVGKLVDLDRDTVSLCIKTYIEGGIEALCFFNYGTNKSELEEYSESILESLKQRPPMSLKEAKARIEEMTGIDRSITQISTFIQSHGLRYIKAGHIPAKADIQ